MIEPSMRISLMPLTGLTVTSNSATPARRSSGEEIVPAKISNNPERAELKKMVYRMHNPHHGDVILVRHPKTADRNIVAFELAFDDKSGKVVQFKKDMYVMAQDPLHGNQSTIGYGDIDFPEDMRNKGISYLLHKALADAALITGISKVAIENVVSEEMKHICAILEMGFGADSSFNGAPDAIIKKCNAKLVGKGWEVESLQATRTRLPSPAIASLSQQVSS
jgi:hypothetical protein